MNKTKNTGTPDLSLSYIALRRIIGILGLLLPFICILGGVLFGKIGIQRSISFYYYTNMRDFFTGLMFCTGMFLLTYAGYDKKDLLIAKIAGITGMAIAFFPCLGTDDTSAPAGIFQIPAGISSWIHLAAAAVFFTALAVNSLFLFTKSSLPKAERGRYKNIRNGIYIICGIIIVFSLLGLLIINIVLKNIRQTTIVLVLEAVMLVAFGVSWLVKGETLFKDPENSPS